MTRRLILTRHAKSSRGDPALGDHDRPLDSQGRQAAQAIGRWLVNHDYLPNEVLSSTALRTQQTWQEIKASLPDPATLHREARLYHATPDDILSVLRSAQGHTVLLLGHNPGIAGAAQALAQTPPGHPGFTRYPTAATTVYRFAIDSWAGTKWKQGEVLGFAIPRNLDVA